MKDSKNLHAIGDQFKSSVFGFWHEGALGDFVLFSPLLDALHEVYPSVSFTLWSRPAYRDIFNGKPYPVSVESSDNPFWRALFMDWEWRTVPVPESVAQCVVFFWVGQKQALSVVERLRIRLSRPVYWIQSFPNEGVEEPVGRFLFKQMKKLGFALSERSPSITASPMARSAVRAWLREQEIPEGQYTVVHLGSGGLRKVWPMQRWEKLFKETKGWFDMPVVLLMGPADEVLAPYATRFSREWKWPVYWSSDTNALLGILSMAGFYVGCDSGVSHVAAALGVPSVVIFGPTNPVVWAPRGDHVCIYRDSWDVHDVLGECAQS